MERDQYRRWRGFAIRMAHRGWPLREVMRAEHQRAVIPAVEFFFGCSLKDWGGDDLIHRISSWENTGPGDGDRHSFGKPVTDIVSDLMEQFNPYYWASEEHDRACEGWDELWGARIRCCIRAGIDMAAEPSMGVLGFTVCDLKRMYGGRVPEWIDAIGWFDADEQPIGSLNEGSCEVGIWL